MLNYFKYIENVPFKTIKPISYVMSWGFTKERPLQG